MRRLATFAAFALAAYAPFAAAVDKNTPPPVPAGDYTVDKSHTSLTFRVNHLGFSFFTGRFTNVEANLKFDPARIATSAVNVSVEPRSIHFDNVPDGFLDMLVSEPWLAADKFPKLTYVSKSVEVTGAGKFRINGELTLHGVTKPVRLDATYNGGYAGHPMDPNARIGFSARGTFKRSEFGVTIGLPPPGTHMGVSDEVEVILESEFSGPPLRTAQR